MRKHKLEPTDNQGYSMECSLCGAFASFHEPEDWARIQTEECPAPTPFEKMKQLYTELDLEFSAVEEPTYKYIVVMDIHGNKAEFEFDEHGEIARNGYYGEEKENLDLTVKEILCLEVSKQTRYVMEQSLALQHAVAGSMPYDSFELLSEEERKQHVENALSQMPQDILEEILTEYLFL